MRHLPIPSAGGHPAPAHVPPPSPPTCRAGSSSGNGSGLTLAAEEAAAPWRQQAAVQPPVGRDPTEKPQSAADLLPDWVGYGMLYAVSALPVFIAGTVIAVLFFNSLR